MCAVNIILVVCRTSGSINDTLCGAPEHGAAHGGVGHRPTHFGQALVVPCEAARAPDPRIRFVRPPSAAADLEAGRTLLQAVAPRLAGR